MLAHYAQEFDTVEINNTFYRLPEKQTFADWAATAPSGFRFAVKASRFITHIKRLRDPEEPIDRLFSRAIALGRHFGPVLFQLPPNWKLDEGRLREFLEKSPRDHQCAFEFRDLSWFSRRTYELLSSKCGRRSERPARLADRGHRKLYLSSIARPDRRLPRQISARYPRALGGVDRRARTAGARHLRLLQQRPGRTRDHQCARTADHAG